MIAKGFTDASIADILSIPPEMLALHFLGVTELPARISAPYRIDRNPSLYLFVGRNGKLMFSDFAKSEDGDILDLLSKIWGTDQRDTINRVRREMKDKMPVGKAYNKGNYTSGHRSSTHASYRLAIKTRGWMKHDLEFWETYGISKEWLEFGEVVPISHIFIDDKPVRVEKYAYAYIERKDGNLSYKIYQPFSKEYKWRNNHNSSVWDLWTKIPDRGERLIITSSRKDALCVWENTGVPAVSMQGEGYMPKNQVMYELKSRYSKIYILYDNDFKGEENHGRMFGKALSDKFHLMQIEIPETYRSKDPSDLCKNRGRQCVYDLIHKLMDDADASQDNSPF